jgi:hypothetical protein
MAGAQVSGALGPFGVGTLAVAILATGIRTSTGFADGPAFPWRLAVPVWWAVDVDP